MVVAIEQPIVTYEVTYKVEFTAYIWPSNPPRVS